MLLVVSETFTTHEHSLHDFFQTYLSDPPRHWFSDCNRPRHRTPGLPQIMLMHILLGPCVLFLYINMTHTYLNQWRESTPYHASDVPRSNMKQVANLNEQKLSFTKNMLLFEEIGSLYFCYVFVL